MIKRVKLRTLLLGGFITLLFVVLLIRVFVLQVINGDKWHERAVFQWTRNLTIPASRGMITDRNGDILVSDVPAYTVIVNPAVIHENGLENEVIEGLHKILGKDESELKELVNAKKDGKYRPGREVRNEGWKIDEAKKAQIDDLNKELMDQLEKEKKGMETGIGFRNEQKRYYPKGTLAAHILGYTNRDGEAVAGLEAYKDDVLKGTPGEMKYESDRQGDQLPEASMVYKPAVNGKNIKLTIDDRIQSIIEDAMKETYEKYKPISMTVIAADPKTMEILGMANLPTFDPNTYWDPANEQKDFFNYAVKATYEPGSTFKIVTLAGAVQEKLFNPNATYQSGQIYVKGTQTPLHDIVRSGWGQITYLEGVKRSSNVAFVKLGSEMLGKDRLLKYIKDFGFGQKTGIELPGEVSTTINLPGPVEVATASYGHGVSVTPIQQLAAISAVANGGKLLKPHIIKEVTDPDSGKVTQSSKTDVVRQVISPEAAKETSSYLEQVVADQVIGTGREAYIDGYRIAGKTGTAVKYGPDKNPDYSKSVVSFIGFAPVNDPRIALIVIVDQPNDPKAGGGKVAAPIFKKVVSQALPYLGVPKANTKKNSDGKSTVDRPAAPTLTKLAVKDAKQMLLNAGIDFEAIGKGTSVIRQYPAAGTPMSPGQRIYLLTEETDKTTVPDLKGESLRDALDILTLLKCSVTVQGEGYVTEQLVTDKNGKRSVQLTLKPIKDDEALQDASSPSTEDDSISEDTSADDLAADKSDKEAGDN